MRKMIRAVALTATSKFTASGVALKTSPVYQDADNGQKLIIFTGFSLKAVAASNKRFF